MGYRVADKEKRKRHLAAELARIVDILRTRGVEKVILFGSFAAGNVGSTSDIDLIVVEKTEKTRERIFGATSPSPCWFLIYDIPQRELCPHIEWERNAH